MYVEYIKNDTVNPLFSFYTLSFDLHFRFVSLQFDKHQTNKSNAGYSQIVYN